MDFLQQLNESIKLPNVVYHKFLTSYRKNSSDIYVFCEGNVDLNYYCELIERKYPTRGIQKFVSECKNNVLLISGYIDWKIYSKERVLFFVDRDLSYWAGEPQDLDKNIYITDHYSFENDAVNLHMFLKLLEDIYGFSSYTPNEKEKIEDLFEKYWKEFVNGSYCIMGCILYAYMTRKEHVANNIRIRKCFSLEEPGIWKPYIDNIPSVEYYKKVFEIDDDISQFLEQYKNRFIEEAEHYSVRGKWCIVFMVMLMDYVLKEGKSFAPSLYNGITKKPKRLTNLDDKSGMATIGPKIVPPKSLVDFIDYNLSV